MELSAQIKDMIKTWEGCRLTAYRCPSGVLTIGYGHTGTDVTEGKTITQKEADELFETDINKFASAVTKILDGVNVNNNQFDALVSFAYNVGLSAFEKSTLLKRVKANPNSNAIRIEFRRWNRGGGKVLPGLTARRIYEANHYFRR